jgi:hypothetical protein
MSAICRELRAIYAEIITEGVPERFAKILRRLDDPSNKGPLDDARTAQAKPTAAQAR